MVDEQEPTKRVVKRVVKKTVVRPVTSAGTKPQVRYGRPVATATKPQPKVASRPATSAKNAPATKLPRQRIDVRDRLDAARERTAHGWSIIADGISRGSRTGGSYVAARARTVAAWRLPHLNLYLASIITGAVVGLVSVGLGVLALTIFESVRGVSSGGGLWGGIAFTAIAIGAALLGESLLRGFGSRSARLTSSLAVVLVIVAVLGLFLDLADSWAALVLVPLLGVAAYSLSHWLVELAENTPAVID
jgi:hypothetical protein